MNKKTFETFTQLENRFKALEKEYKALKSDIIAEVKETGEYTSEVVHTENGDKLVERWVLSLAHDKTIVTVTNNPRYTLIQSLIPEAVKTECMGFQDNTTLKHN